MRALLRFPTPVYERLRLLSKKLRLASAIASVQSHEKPDPLGIMSDAYKDDYSSGDNESKFHRLKRKVWCSLHRGLIYEHLGHIASYVLPTAAPENLLSSSMHPTLKPQANFRPGHKCPIID